MLAIALPLRAEDAPATAAADALEEARSHVRAVQQNLEEALAKVRRSSVSILCKVQPRSKDGQPVGPLVVRSGGSGVVIRYGNKSWIVTNQHVVNGAEHIVVIDCEGREHDVSVHDAVENQDIALLAFDDPKTADIDAVVVRKDASRKIEEGTWVIATGNPFFLAKEGYPSATLGVVSGLDRVLGSEYVYGRAIQHDAKVNPGNSGGPLWNLDGELVGINGMIMIREMNEAGAPVSSGVSFAIPIDQIWGHLRTLVDKRKDAKAPFLGLVTRTCTDVAGKPIGAEVVEIQKGSPCGQVGGSSKYLQKGDVILSFSPGGKRYGISTESDLANALMQAQAGATVSVRVRREKKVFTWTGKLGTQE